MDGLKQLKCKRCDHHWWPRGIGGPVACPKCHSLAWNREPKPSDPGPKRGGGRP